MPAGCTAYMSSAPRSVHRHVIKRRRLNGVEVHASAPNPPTQHNQQASLFDSKLHHARSKAANQAREAEVISATGHRQVPPQPDAPQQTNNGSTGTPTIGSDDSWGTYLNNILSYPFSKRRAGASSKEVDNVTPGRAATLQQVPSTVSPGKQVNGEPSSLTGSNSGLTLLFRRRASGSAQPAVVEDRPLPSSDHAVLQLLQQRHQQGSRPGQRSDHFKLGLVVEGGGMRGAVTGGALMALLDLGLRDCFDAVYGSSAGAINATYFLSGQSEGVRIYHEDIANKDFVDLNRLMKGPGPVLNLDMLLDDVMHNTKPLDWDAVLSSQVPLKVVASSLDALQAVILDDFEDKDDLLCCLRSTANIPAIVGPPVWHRGQRLVDAAVFEAIPFRSAIADGCTHVLTLCSRPPPRFGTLMNSLEDALGEAIKRAVLSPDYMREAWRKELEVVAREGCTHDQQLLMGLRPDHPQLPFFSGSYVCPVYPGAPAKIAPVCIDPVALRAGVDEGYSSVMKVVSPLVMGQVADDMLRRNAFDQGAGQLQLVQ